MHRPRFILAALLFLLASSLVPAAAQAALAAEEFPGDATNGYRLRFEMETSSDWSRFWLEDGAEMYDWIVETYSPGTRDCGFDDAIFLNQALDRAEAGASIRISGHAYLIPPVSGTLRFGIAKGDIGATTVRLFNEMNTEPFLINEFVFAGVNQEDPDNNKFFDAPFGPFQERRLPPGAKKIAAELDDFFEKWIVAQKARDADALDGMYWSEASVLTDPLPDADIRAARLMSGPEEIGIFIDETLASGLIGKLKYPVPVRTFRDLERPVYIARWRLGGMRWSSFFAYEKREGAWKILEQRIVMSW